jgi:hypothetical protein
MASLAEDVVLLLLDDDSGKPLVDSTRLPRVLAGAVLVDLSMAGAVRVTGRGEDIKAGRLAVDPSIEVADPVAARALRILAESKPLKPARAIEKLVKWVRTDTLAHAQSAGWVHQRRAKVLGIIPRTTWPAADRSRKRAVHRDVEQVLVEGMDPSTRTAAVISLLSAVGAVRKVLPTADRRAVTTRAKQIAKGDWAGDAVGKSVAAVEAAVIAVIAAGAVGGAAGGSG